MFAKEKLKKAAQRDSLTGLYNVGTAKKRIRGILRNQTKNLHKKIVQGFLLYNEFNKNITKESDPVRQKHYTTEKQAVGKNLAKYLF